MIETMAPPLSSVYPSTFETIDGSTWVSPTAASPSGVVATREVVSSRDAPCGSVESSGPHATRPPPKNRQAIATETFDATGWEQCNGLSIP
ncbi:hypothetical protein GCM10023350_52010 [Nocardioides endophyticus]|uniref:Uncharacterized protein n=1 Tax=Nocardioides endophyticus TaxID=1353775 RepID=A0ABP8ZL20_9ACTN